MKLSEKVRRFFQHRCAACFYGNHDRCKGEGRVNNIDPCRCECRKGKS